MAIAYGAAWNSTYETSKASQAVAFNSADIAAYDATSTIWLLSVVCQATFATACDLDGSAMTMIDQATDATSAVNCSLWYLHDTTNSFSGYTGDCNVTLDDVALFVSSSLIALTGVHLTTPIDSYGNGTGVSSAPTVALTAAAANNWAVLAAGHNQANSAITASSGTRRGEVHGALGGEAILTLGPNSAGSVIPSFAAVAITKRWAATGVIIAAPPSATLHNLSLLGVGR